MGYPYGVKIRLDKIAAAGRKWNRRTCAFSGVRRDKLTSRADEESMSLRDTAKRGLGRKRLLRDDLHRNRLLGHALGLLVGDGHLQQVSPDRQRRWELDHLHDEKIMPAIT